MSIVSYSKNADSIQLWINSGYLEIFLICLAYEYTFIKSDDLIIVFIRFIISHTQEIIPNIQKVK